MNEKEFRTIVEESISRLLLEGRKEDALKKYPHLARLIETFASEDPSGNLKYLQWQIKAFQTKSFSTAEIVDVINLFHKYGNRLQKKDINAWNPSDLLELKEQLEDIQQDVSAKKKHEKKAEDAARCESKIIYEDSDFLVRHIFGKKASIHYGRGTKWCITMADHSYYEDYEMNNVVFFFVTRKKAQGDRDDKVAISIQRNTDNKEIKTEFWDSADNSLYTSDVYTLWGKSYHPIMLAVRETSATFAKSPMAALLSGELATEEAMNVYRAQTGSDATFNTEGMLACRRILEANDNQAAAVVNDMAQRAVNTYQASGDDVTLKQDVGFYLVMPLVKQEQVDTKYFIDFMQMDFGSQSDNTRVKDEIIRLGKLPTEATTKFLDNAINQFIANDDALASDYDPLIDSFIVNANEIPLETQKKIVGLENWGMMRSLVENQKITLDPSVVDKILSLAVIAHRAKTLNPNKMRTSFWYYEDIILTIIEKYAAVIQPDVKEELAKIKRVNDSYNYMKLLFPEKYENDIPF